MRTALVGKKTGMEAVCVLSDYVERLPSEAKKRYEEKLKYASGSGCLPDPYAIADGWVDDPSTWPDLQFGDIYCYLIDTPGMFTKESLKAYKSLEAYRSVMVIASSYFIFRSCQKCSVCFTQFWSRMLQ
jgi:hypothetical protein